MSHMVRWQYLHSFPRWRSVVSRPLCLLALFYQPCFFVGFFDDGRGPFHVRPSLARSGDGRLTVRLMSTTQSYLGTETPPPGDSESLYNAGQPLTSALVHFGVTLHSKFPLLFHFQRCPR